MKKKGLKILLVCIVNRNYGDTIIADCTEYLIKKALGKTAEDCSIMRYKIDCGDLWQIGFADMVIFAGGGLIKFRQEEFYTHFAQIIAEADRHGVPVFINSVGVEGYDGEDECCLMLKEHINMDCVKGISVRDDIDLLKEKYITRHGLRVRGVFDPAVCAGEVYGAKGGNGNVIGLNVARGKLFPDYGNPQIDEEYMLDFWCGVAGLLEEKGQSWRVFTNGAGGDERFADKLMERLGHGEKLPTPMSAEELVNNISSFSGIIAVRMHACITSYSLGIPCVSLVWNDKLRIWGDKIGSPASFIKPDDIKPDVVVEQLFNVLQRGRTKVGFFKKHGVYHELKRFISVYGDNRNVSSGGISDKIIEVGMGGIQHRYKAPNSLDELKRRLDEGCRLIEADVRATSDGKAVCINGWSEKNLIKLGVEPQGLERRELPMDIFKSHKLDGTFAVGSFEDTVGILKNYDGARLIIDVGLPPADLKEAMFRDIADILNYSGVDKEKIFIRLQREGDIELWNAQNCRCELMYFLPDSDVPKERETKQSKALSVCKKYEIKYISMVAGTFNEETSKLLKKHGLLPVVFSYEKLGDAAAAVEQGAYMAGSFYYSSKYADDLLK